MKNELRLIMRNIKSKVICKNNYKIITVFLLTPQDDKGKTFILDVIAGVKENEKYNNYTKIFYNESLPFSAKEFKEFMLQASELYRVEAIVPDAWRNVNKYWWSNLENEIELIDYATKNNKWECGKIGFKIIQRF